MLNENLFVISILENQLLFLIPLIHIDIRPYNKQLLES